MNLKEKMQKSTNLKRNKITMKKVKRQVKGITLIALVVTIVILLILAGVSINLVLGPNGLITKAQEAALKTEEAALEEKIELLAAGSIIDEYSGNSEEKTAQELQDELKEQGENVLVIQWDKYIIFDLDQNKEYRVMNDGSVEYWGESTMGKTLLNSKTANPDQIAQDSSTSNIIGIDNDGNTVNMLLWKYTLIDDSSLGKIGTYGLNDKNGLDGSGSLGRSAGYIGEYTEDGKIIGTVPAYISTDGGNTYTSVTSMAHTFYDCDELIIAPEIAETVTNMEVTFYQAINLTTPPSKIPDSVINLSYTFASCEKLNNVPMLGRNINNMKASFRYTSITEFNIEIPISVTIMKETFRGCTGLIEFNAEIPDGVTNMSATFSGCTGLTEFNTEIPNSVTDMSNTFQGCTSLSEFNSNIPNSVTNMSDTFSGCTSLEKGPSVIPNTVENMMQTFSDCYKLSGTMEINANLNGKVVYNYNNIDYYDYTQCFLRAGTNGTGLTIINTSSTPKDILYKLIVGSTNVVIEE